MSPIRPHFAPWDERDWPRVISPEDGARRVRLFAAIEKRQSELLEQWAGIVSEPHLQTTLARHARHAAWHADLWTKHIADGASPNGSTTDADVTALLDAVARPAGEGEAVEFLTGIYRVLIPRKIAAYTYYQRAIGTQDSDADWRWIDFILKDELDAIRDGELSLQTLLVDDEGVKRSAGRRAELESLLVQSGGLIGPDTLGMTAQTR